MWDTFSKELALLDSQEGDYAQVEGFIEQRNLTIFEGRALYPRYFSAGEGFPLTGKFGYEINDEARLVFELVGQRTGRAIFPLAESPHFFPNAADVTIIVENNSFDKIWLILVSKNGQKAIYTSTLLQNAFGGK